MATRADGVVIPITAYTAYGYAHSTRALYEWMSAAGLEWMRLPPLLVHYLHVAEYALWGQPLVFPPDCVRCDETGTPWYDIDAVAFLEQRARAIHEECIQREYAYGAVFAPPRPATRDVDTETDQTGVGVGTQCDGPSRVDTESQTDTGAVVQIDLATQCDLPVQQSPTVPQPRTHELDWALPTYKPMGPADPPLVDAPLPSNVAPGDTVNALAVIACYVGTADERIGALGAGAKPWERELYEYAQTASCRSLPEQCAAAYWTFRGLLPPYQSACVLTAILFVVYGSGRESSAVRGMLKKARAYAGTHAPAVTVYDVVADDLFAQTFPVAQCKNVCALTRAAAASLLPSPLLCMLYAHVHVFPAGSTAARWTQLLYRVAGTCDSSDYQWNLRVAVAHHGWDSARLVYAMCRDDTQKGGVRDAGAFSSASIMRDTPGTWTDARLLPPHAQVCDETALMQSGKYAVMETWAAGVQIGADVTTSLAVHRSLLGTLHEIVAAAGGIPVLGPPRQMCAILFDLAHRLAGGIMIRAHVMARHTLHAADCALSSVMRTFAAVRSHALFAQSRSLATAAMDSFSANTEMQAGALYIHWGVEWSRIAAPLRGLPWVALAKRVYAELQDKVASQICVEAASRHVCMVIHVWCVLLGAFASTAALADLDADGQDNCAWAFKVLRELASPVRRLLASLVFNDRDRRDWVQHLYSTYTRSILSNERNVQVLRLGYAPGVLARVVEALGANLELLTPVFLYERRTGDAPGWVECSAMEVVALSTTLADRFALRPGARPEP